MVPDIDDSTVLGGFAFKLPVLTMSAVLPKFGSFQNHAIIIEQYLFFNAHGIKLISIINFKFMLTLKELSNQTGLTENVIRKHMRFFINCCALNRPQR
jgi:hypothetical protein